MWSCEDVKLLNCETVKLWRCEDVKMQNCKIVKLLLRVFCLYENFISESKLIIVHCLLLHPISVLYSSKWAFFAFLLLCIFTNNRNPNSHHWLLLTFIPNKGFQETTYSLFLFESTKKKQKVLRLSINTV